MSKLSEYHVGILDFFAILLPGAIATAILEPKFGHLIVGNLITAQQSEAGKWAAFLAFSYFLGHLVFLVGSCIDRLYKVLREQLSPYGNESAYQCATRIRDMLIEESERKALNTFQWSRSVLIAKCPAAAEDVHRLEADSKFFRSLLVVSALSSIVFFADARNTEGIVALGLVVPCFVRYYERRLKSTTRAYVHIVTLHRLGILVPDARSNAV